MKKIITLLLLAAATLNACKEKTTTTESKEVVNDSLEVKMDSEIDSSSIYTAGTSFDTKEAITITEMLNQFTTDSAEFVIKGTIDKVCQVKGCWMHLEMPDSTQSMRVTFKDYEFFVPKDASGKTAIIKGIVKQDTTSVEDLRHYAVDGGMTEEEAANTITEPKIELAFEAEGVQVK